jgi:16S rRNA (cytosine967-C5)-methyltransferase
MTAQQRSATRRVPTRARRDSRNESARSVALDVIVAVLKDDAYANLLLSSRISAAGLDGRDAGLATELCHGTLRGRGKYDAIIAQTTDRPIEKIHPVVLAALEMGCHQHLAMRVSTHAAVNETVELVRQSGMGPASGFANAVMRRVTERTADEWDAELVAGVSDETQKREFLTSHPAWIIRAFESALNADGRQGDLDALLAADNEQTALGIVDLRLDGSPSLPGCRRAAYSPIGWHLAADGNPASLTSVGGGKVRVQDEGSQLAALALVQARPLVEGETWLDMCAAPGGKSAVLAAFASQAGSYLSANEANAGRLDLVKRSIAPWPNVEVTNRDGRSFGEDGPAYDRILVDAPCSGLGALRRRPEARWRKTPKDIAALTALQEELLVSALDSLRPGGVVAYVTCSPHVAETRAIVNAAVKKRPEAIELVTREVLEGCVLNSLETPLGVKSVQLWPHIHATDAMFIALLQKSP